MVDPDTELDAKGAGQSRHQNCISRTISYSRRTLSRPPQRLLSRPARSYYILVLLVLAGIFLECLPQRTFAQTVSDSDNEYADFVQQVVEEDQDQHDVSEDDYDYDYARQQQQQQEEELFRQQQQQQQQREQQEERLRQDQEERNRRIRHEREAALDAELTQLSDDPKRKAAAQKQRKRDAAVVQRILRDAAKGNHYAVLGLRYQPWFSLHLHIPERTLGVASTKFRLHIPALRWGRCDGAAWTAAELKRAYRERARRVHPDKCRDGRAVEAFHAVEHSATLLLDAPSRAVYDQQLAQQRRAQHEQLRVYVRGGWELVILAVGRVQRLFQLLGPLAMPLSIWTVMIL